VKTSLDAVPALTVKAALVPVLPEAVAAMVNEPVFVIVTLCGSSTPAVNVPDVTGLPVRAPVEVSDTVEVNDVTVLLFTSCAVILKLNAVPAVCVPIVPPPLFSTLKWSRAPGLTVAIVAKPVWLDPSVTVTVRLLPATVGVTLALVNTPAVNAADVPVTPAVPPNVTVEVKLVTVLLFVSFAVIVAIWNAVPAVCGEEMVEMAK
jgi:hypothetical protein